MQKPNDYGRGKCLIVNIIIIKQRNHTGIFIYEIKNIHIQGINNSSPLFYDSAIKNWEVLP